MTGIEKVLYTGRTRTTGGRDGSAQSDDGRLKLALSRPGSSGSGTNPEQLFAAAWSACFIGAMARAAATMNLKVPPDVALKAEVDLGNDAQGGFLLQARLLVELPGLSKENALALANAAHQLCPYSKATRGNIEVSIQVA